MRRVMIASICLLLLASGCERWGESGTEEEEEESSPVRVEAVEIVPELLVHRVALTGQLAAEHSVMVKSDSVGSTLSLYKGWIPKFSEK